MVPNAVRVADTLRGVRRLFLDTAPVAYFLERHPLYQSVVTPVFRAIDQGTPVGITSPISLAECLVLPYRLGNAAVAQVFLAFFLTGRNVSLASIDANVGQAAADLRARYNLTLTDALQVAVALDAGCEALLTNDAVFRRVGELRIIMIDDLEP